MKLDLKRKAISLRQDGLTYSEILKVVPVAKSTLSEWLHSVSLAKHQVQRLTEKKRLGALRGAASRKADRLARQTKIMNLARAEIGEVSKRELWLMGTMLYWAEGAKEKKWRTGEKVQFSNSDPTMVKLFLIWLENCLEIPFDQIDLSLYIHESQKEKIQEHKDFWILVVGMRYNTSYPVYYKKNKPATKRRNVGNSYHGQLRVSVRKSIDLNRKIAGWVEGVCSQCPVV